MKLVMIGAGYVGLVSGACLADCGHHVVCVDRDRHKLAALRTGAIPIYEPGLEALVSRNVADGRLSFTDQLADAVSDADAVFIAVGTPSRQGDGLADLTHVYQVARDIAPHLTGFTVVVTKSTVPGGTGDEIAHLIATSNPDVDVAVVSNPEFLREGAAIADFRSPDRIVVGTDEPRAREIMTAIYAPLAVSADRMVWTARRTAELTKYAANAFLAMKITFINEVADLCEQLGADVTGVARGIGLDERIGPRFLAAGPGIGGSCFPKDTLALVKTAQDADSPLRLVETTVLVNEQRKRAMAKKVIRACGGSVRGKTVGVLGLTFKPDTDDIRESASIPLIRALQDAGAKVAAHDPAGMEHAKAVLGNVRFCDDPHDVARQASALVIVTEWAAYNDLDWDRTAAMMAAPNLVDLRNMIGRDRAAAAGLTYTDIGRGDVGVLRDDILRQAAE